MKFKVRRTVPLLIGGLAAVFVAAGALMGSTAEAQNGKCSLQTLKGSYAARIDGWFGAGAGRLPYASAGFVALDGKGNITGEAMASLDGSIFPQTIVGTYTVDSDTCTGNATSTIGDFFFAIADNGKQTRIVATTPGTTVTGEAIRQ